MKYLKMLGLVAVAAAALTASAGVGSASGTTLTCTLPPGTKVICPKGTVIDATAEESLTLKAGFANVTCTESTVKAKTSNTGSSTETLKAAVETLTFGNCGSFVVTVITKGALEIHTELGVSSNNNGTVTSLGAEVTTALGKTSCAYGTLFGEDIGQLTGSTTKGGGTPTVDISAELELTAGGILCADPAKWEGKYKITEPDWLDVD